MKRLNFVDLFDLEKESDRDYIFMLERELDIEKSYQEWIEKQPAKIIFNENHIRKSSFPRTIKKILQLRSHLFTEINS